MIDLKSVHVVASNSACLSFPVTANLTHFGITPGDMQIRTSNTDSWPEVAEPRNGRDGQAGTLWGFKQVNGVWYAAGIERLRKYQLNGSKPVAEPRYGGLGTLFGDGWCEKADFGPLSHNNPKPGEPVGFCVVAGDSRLGFNCPYQARTEIIVVEWPGEAGGQPLKVLWREGEAIPQPATEPAPTPAQNPVTPLPPMVSQPPQPASDPELKKALGDVIQWLKTIDGTLNQLLEIWK